MPLREIILGGSCLSPVVDCYGEEGGLLVRVLDFRNVKIWSNLLGRDFLLLRHKLTATKGILLRSSSVVRSFYAPALVQSIVV